MLKSCPQYTELYRKWHDAVAEGTRIFTEYTETGNDTLLEKFTVARDAIKIEQGHLLKELEVTVPFTHRTMGPPILVTLEAEVLNMFKEKGMDIDVGIGMNNHVYSIKLKDAHQKSDRDFEVFQAYLKYFIHLTSFYCSGNNTITTLPILPDTVETVMCVSCDSLVTISHLPKFLKKLTCGGEFVNKNTVLKNLPDSFPETLEELTCKYAPITHIHSLPKNLQRLFLDNCTELQTLPLLPNTLKSIVVSGCKELNRETTAMITEHWRTHPGFIFMQQ